MNAHLNRPIEWRPRILAWLAGWVAFLTIFDWYELFDVPFLRNPSALTAVLLVTVYFFKRGMRFKLTRQDHPQLWLLVFLFFTIILELYRELVSGHGSLVSTMIWYLQYVQVAVLFLLISDICRDPRHLFLIWSGVIAGAFFMATAVIFQFPAFTEEVEGLVRRGFAGVNLNRQSYYYALSIITLVWALLERRHRLDLTFFVTVVGIFILFLPMLWTASRGPFIALVFGLATLLVITMRRRNVRTHFTYAPLIIAGLFTLAAQSELLVQRMQLAIEGEHLALRDVIFSASIQLINERPLFGYGAAHTRFVGHAIGFGGGYSPHNVFFQVILSFGLIAFVFWSLFIGSVLMKLLKHRNNPVTTLFVSLLVCSLVYGFTGGIAHDKYFWFVLGLSVFAWRSNVPSVIFSEWKKKRRNTMVFKASGESGHRTQF